MFRTRDNSTANIGNGSNKVEISLMDDESSLKLGDGENIFLINRMRNNSEIIFGDGNSVLIANIISENSLIKLGNGDNLLLSATISDDAGIQLGDGNNVVYSAFISKNTSLTFGNGVNLLLVKALLCENLQLSKNSSIQSHKFNKLDDQGTIERVASERGISGFGSFNISDINDTIFAIFNNKNSILSGQQW